MSVVYDTGNTAQITLQCMCGEIADSFTYARPEPEGSKWQDGMPCPACGEADGMTVYLSEPSHPDDVGDAP